MSLFPPHAPSWNSHLGSSSRAASIPAGPASSAGPNPPSSVGGIPVTSQSLLPSQEGNAFFLEGESAEANATADSPSNSVKKQGSGEDSPQKNYASSMAVAIDEARSGMAAGHGGPFGAVVIKGDTIVGRGHNRVLSSHDPTAHAEVTALRDAAQTLGTHVLSGCVLVTTCEPCPMCFSAAFWSRVDRIVYAATRHDAAAVGFDDAKLYEILSGSKDAGVKGAVSFIVKIEAPEAIELFNEWTLSETKELY